MDEAIEIVPAAVIYNVNSESCTAPELKRILKDFRDLMLDQDEDREVRIQAWQFVKAYTKIISEREEWRNKNAE